MQPSPVFREAALVLAWANVIFFVAKITQKSELLLLCETIKKLPVTLLPQIFHTLCGKAVCMNTFLTVTKSRYYEV